MGRFGDSPNVVSLKNNRVAAIHLFDAVVFLIPGFGSHAPFFFDADSASKVDENKDFIAPYGARSGVGWMVLNIELPN